MRAIDCPCGTRLDAESDEALAALLRSHLELEHPDMQLTEAELRETLALAIRDAVTV
jgi:hypothetical protein